MWQMKVFDAAPKRVEQEFNTWMLTHQPLHALVSQAHRVAGGNPDGMLLVVVTYEEFDGPTIP